MRYCLFYGDSAAIWRCKYCPANNPTQFYCDKPYWNLCLKGIIQCEKDHRALQRYFVRAFHDNKKLRIKEVTKFSIRSGYNKNVEFDKLINERTDL